MAVALVREAAIGLSERDAPRGEERRQRGTPASRRLIELYGAGRAEVNRVASRHEHGAEVALTRRYSHLIHMARI